LKGRKYPQYVEGQADIYIGRRNNVIGWSAYGKTNQVLEEISGQSNLVMSDVLLSNNPDFIFLICQLMLVKAIPRIFQNSSLFVVKGNFTGMDANEKDNYRHGPIV
jgi:hypothetical protein